MKSNIATHKAGERLPAFRRLSHAWEHSLRFRLLWLGLMPLLLALPLVLIALSVVGGTQLNRLIEGQLNSNLSSAQNYLNVVRSDLQSRIADLVQSDRITQLIEEPVPQHEFNQVLKTLIRGSGFDFLLIVNDEGTVLGSSSGVERTKKVPPSFVIRQAQLGVASSGFEQFTLQELESFSPIGSQRLFETRHRTGGQPLPNIQALQEKGTLITAAAHFPLSITAQDAVLVGGVFLDHNTALIEHLREIIYPTGKLPDRTEGFAGIFVGQHSIVNSRLITLSSSAVQLTPALVPTNHSAGLSTTHFGIQRLGQENFALAVSPIQNGEENTIAALVVGFPIAPYQDTAWLLLAVVAALLGLTMLVVSAIYLNAGNRIVQKLKKIATVINLFRDGEREAKIEQISSKDELGLLATRVNELLSTIAKQELEQIAAQRTISDEASRRRAIFRNVRDGIVILDDKGRVFEANMQFCAMLGYAEEEVKTLHISDWDHAFFHDHLFDQIQNIERHAGTIESNLIRKDRTTFPVELSVSHAKWAGKSFYLLLARDITMRKQQENRLKLSASVFTAAMEAIVLTDPHARITDVNDAYTQIMGYEKDEVTGKLATSIGYTQNDQALLEQIMASLRSTGFWTGEMLQQRKNGQQFPSLVRVSAVKNDAGEVQHFVAMFSDISLEKEQQLRLEQIALHDSLTGLANRQSLSDRLSHAMATSHRTGSHIALLMMDLDNFKPLNDKHGHAAGDQLLIEVGRRLKASVREVDTVARLGGDEFVVLLESLPADQDEAETQALQIAEKIRKAIDQAFIITDFSLDEQQDIAHHCTSSIGVAVFKGKTLSHTHVLNMADAAMYQAKNAGKNIVNLYRLSATNQTSV